ncbi:hypothetical protein KKG46_05585 [Patescibacteria group bacterium]|nr:hypothetical protein [Patescibacteria group bacterium]
MYDESDETQRDSLIPEKEIMATVVPPQERPRIYIRIQTALVIGITGVFVSILFSTLLAQAGLIASVLGTSFCCFIGLLIINVIVKREYDLHAHQLFLKSSMYGEPKMPPELQVIRMGYWFPEDNPEQVCVVAAATHKMFDGVICANICSSLAPKGHMYIVIKSYFDEGRNVLVLEPTDRESLAKPRHNKMRELLAEENQELKITLYGDNGTQAQHSLYRYKSI